MKTYSIFIGVVCSLCAVGCARFTADETERYQTVSEQCRRDVNLAKRMHEKALSHLDCCEYDKAEQFLNKALIADVSFGPAHNTLGKLYFDQKKYYLAAWEFDYASRLMPERAEPINNVGLVLESTGRLDDAIEQYHAAFTMESDNANYLGNLVRARFRRGDRTDDLRELMQQVVFMDDRQTWTHWAREKLSMWDSKWKNTPQDFDLDSSGIVNPPTDGLQIEELPFTQPKSLNPSRETLPPNY
jgi:Tfp pilus assembly protein PilF